MLMKVGGDVPRHDISLSLVETFADTKLTLGRTCVRLGTVRAIVQVVCNIGGIRSCVLGAI